MGHKCALHKEGKIAMQGVFLTYIRKYMLLTCSMKNGAANYSPSHQFLMYAQQEFN